METKFTLPPVYAPYANVSLYPRPLSVPSLCPSKSNIGRYTTNLSIFTLSDFQQPKQNCSCVRQKLPLHCHENGFHTPNHVHYPHYLPNHSAAYLCHLAPHQEKIGRAH